MKMDNMYYTQESEIIANDRAYALMIAHDKGAISNRQYCDECMNIVTDLLRLDISKNAIKEESIGCTWVKEKMLKE